MPVAELPDIVDFALFLGERTGCEEVMIWGDETGSLSVGKDRTSRVLPGSESTRETYGAHRRVVPVVVDPLTSSAPGISGFVDAMEGARVGLVVQRPGPDGEEGRIRDLLRAEGVEVAFSGHTRDRDIPDSTRKASVFVCENRESPLSRLDLRAPPDFVVIAFMIVYNESDIFEASLSALNSQGVEAYVIDNWSTDGTFEMARERVGRGVAGVERHPHDGPPEYFDLRSLLTRVEALVPQLDANWYIKHDADEIRQSPWPELSLRDAIWLADTAGYNCLDFTVLNFRPIDESWAVGADPIEHFAWFEFGRNPGHFKQWKAWKDFGQEIDYARFGSHSISFEGLRVFPYKFLLRHYPIRSQAHGERKVFSERQARFLPEAKKRGWHKQYDHFQPGQSFISAPEDLIEFGSDFADRYLIERLSGVGLERVQL